MKKFYGRDLKFLFLFLGLGLVGFSYLLYFLCSVFAPVYNVGVLGVDDVEIGHLEAASSGFARYDFVDSKILDVRMNSSYIRQKDGFLLNRDFFDYFDIEELKATYGLDFILFVTDKPIKDWDEEGFGVWGQADSNSDTVVMTTYYFYDDLDFLGSIGLHEILHLFGYLHNPIETEGIMQYANLQGEYLSDFYEFEVPVKVFFKQFIFEKSYFFTVIFLDIMFSLVFFPFFCGIAVLSLFVFDFDEKWSAVLASGVFSSFVLVCLGYSFYVFYLCCFLSFAICYFFE